MDVKPYFVEIHLCAEGHQSGTHHYSKTIFLIDVESLNEHCQDYSTCLLPG